MKINSKIKKALGVAVVSSSIALTACTNNNSTTDTNTTTPISTTNYKDGSYTASGTYQTPESRETISVTLELKDNNIEAVTIDGNGSERESREYISRFKSGINSAVVGKNIDTISLTRVNGSSLTPIGFMSALSSIKSQAKE